VPSCARGSGRSREGVSAHSGAAQRAGSGRRRGERRNGATDLVELVVAPHKDVAAESRAVVVLDGIVLREERLVSRLLVLHS